MSIEKFGNHVVLRPLPYIEKKVRVEIENYLFQNYKPGVYNNYEEINNIIKFLMEFYFKKLDENLNKIASVELLEIILDQYDITCKIDKLKKDLQLDNFELKKWNDFGATFRRALKYISEKIVMINPSIKSIEKNSTLYYEMLSELLISAEELVSLYLQSDSTFKIFPHETELILQKNEPLYWELKVNHWYNQNELNKLQNNWNKLNTDVKIDLDTNLISSNLQKGFEEKFGISFHNVIEIFTNLIHHNDNDGDVTFVEKDIVIQYIENTYDVTKNIAKNILSGFTITSNDLNVETRKVYLPKQEYRLLYRGFLEVTCNQKKYLLWSKNMATESLILLIRGIYYKKFPKEWRSTLINKSINNLSSKLGARFEKLVKDKITNLNIQGDINFKKIIGTKNEHIAIPKDVGELDFLGLNLNTKELIFIECKILSFASEPRLFYDDKTKFNDPKKGYLLKFRKKVDFIATNRKEVLKCLAKQLNVNIDEKILYEFKQRNIILTYYPCIMKAFIKDFELFDLYEFIAKYNVKN